MDSLKSPTYYEVFIKTDCEICKKTVDLLSQKKISFVVTVTDKNPEFLETLKLKNNWPTVPIIFETKFEGGSSQLIGGFSELLEKLNA